MDKLLPRRGRIASGRQPPQVLMPSLATRHVNPKDSVLQFEVGHVPEYAGFYGRVEPALISEFFAEYLPRYGARISGYKDIFVDASKANSFQQNLPIGVVSSDDEKDPDVQEFPAAVTKKDDIQSADNANTLPEDIELEQVMQEWCDMPEVEEEQIKEVKTSLKSKLKRKKLSSKCVTTDDESSKEDEHLVQPNVEKDSHKETISSKNSKKENINSNNKDDTDKDAKGEPEEKKEVKRRRYDLRNSKPRRSY